MCLLLFLRAIGMRTNHQINARTRERKTIITIPIQMRKSIIIIAIIIAIEVVVEANTKVAVVGKRNKLA